MLNKSERFNSLFQKYQSFSDCVENIIQHPIFATQQLTKTITAEQPIQFSQHKLDKLDSPYAQVKSQKPFNITQKHGIVAEMKGTNVEGVENLKEYKFGIMVFDCLDEEGNVLESKEVDIGSFKTFEYGKPERQVAEFLSTIFDYELHMLGFSAFRQDKRIVFIGLPEKAGINLKISNYYFDPEKTESNGIECEFGLKVGLSTLQQGQKKGKSAITSYGKFLINNVEINLHSIKREAPSLEKAKEGLLKLLNEQAHHTLVEAAFDPNDHLILRHYQPGNQNCIQIKRIQELTSQATEHIDLGIPTGIFRGKEEIDIVKPETDLGSININDHPFHFGKIDHSEMSLKAAYQKVIESINAQTIKTGIMASINSSEHIELTILKSDGMLKVSDISNSQNQPLEISPIGFKVLEISNSEYLVPDFIQKIEEYLSLFNQLSTDIRLIVGEKLFIDQTVEFKQIESKLYETVLANLPLEFGIFIKEPFSELLGLQLDSNKDEVTRSWPQCIPEISTYFNMIAPGLLMLGLKLQRLNIQATPSITATNTIQPSPGTNVHREMDKTSLDAQLEALKVSPVVNDHSAKDSETDDERKDLEERIKAAKNKNFPKSIPTRVSIKKPMGKPTITLKPKTQLNRPQTSQQSLPQSAGLNLRFANSSKEELDNKQARQIDNKT